METISKIEELLVVLKEHQIKIGEKEDISGNQIAQWIKARMATLIYELQAIHDDLVAGIKYQELGFASLIDLEQWLEDIEVQIGNLKQMISSLAISI